MAHQIMSARVEALPVANVPYRWLGPAAFGAIVAAAVDVLRKRAIEPGMPRMSSEWLLSHDKLASRYKH